DIQSRTGTVFKHVASEFLGERHNTNSDQEDKYIRVNQLGGFLYGCFSFFLFRSRRWGFFWWETRTQPWHTVGLFDRNSHLPRPPTLFHLGQSGRLFYAGPNHLLPSPVQSIIFIF